MKNKKYLLLLMIPCAISVLGLVFGVVITGCASKPAQLTALHGQRSQAFGFGSEGLVVQNISEPFFSISSPPSSEELWIIARGSDTSTQNTEDAPGSGSLMAKVEEKEVPLPLKHTEVKAAV